MLTPKCTAIPEGMQPAMQVSIIGQSDLVEALPETCECVEMRWTGLNNMGQTAGLGAYPHIKRLSLQGFRCRAAPQCAIYHHAGSLCALFRMQPMRATVEALTVRLLRQLHPAAVRCSQGDRAAT